MHAAVIDDVSSYIKSISKANELDGQDEFFRPKELLFRGQSNDLYELIPSLGRYKDGHEDLCFVERNMIETAKYKMPHVFTKDLQPLELLSLLQHYGIPTRLLDVTENALVALYFACESNPDRDGEVFVFKNLVDDVVDYPIVNAIADSYRFSKGSFCSLASFYEDVIQQPYFLEQKNMNAICNKDSKEGGKWVAECCKTPIFVRASLMLQRQQIQRGRYILFHNELSEPYGELPPNFFSRIKPMAKNDESIIARITVPANKKAAILEEMKMLGIDRGMLFADSVDISCEEIKKDFFDRKR